MAWSGLAVNGGGYLLWAKALNSGDTAKISNLAYCVPAITMVISILFLDERANAYSVAGLVMIIIGIFIQISKKEQTD